LPPQYPFGYAPEDQGADQVLAEVIDGADGVQDLSAGAFPDQGVGDHYG
jgi:hypothetical protein